MENECAIVSKGIEKKRKKFKSFNQLSYDCFRQNIANKKWLRRIFSMQKYMTNKRIIRKGKIDETQTSLNKVL